MLGDVLYHRKNDKIDSGIKGVPVKQGFIIFGKSNLRKHEKTMVQCLITLSHHATNYCATFNNICRDHQFMYFHIQPQKN